jgi:hypothetical protein
VRAIQNHRGAENVTGASGTVKADKRIGKVDVENLQAGLLETFPHHVRLRPEPFSISDFSCDRGP